MFVKNKIITCIILSQLVSACVTHDSRAYMCAHQSAGMESIARNKSGSVIMRSTLLRCRNKVFLRSCRTNIFRFLFPSCSERLVSTWNGAKATANGLHEAPDTRIGKGIPLQ